MNEKWTVKKLRERCQWWQKIMRLEDWKVYVNVVRRWDMGEDRCTGKCDHALDTKTAWIRILDPIDYSPYMIDAPNPEQILIHELLHLHFAPFYSGVITDKSDQEAVAKEQAIEMIACALTKMRHMVEMTAEDILEEVNEK